MTIIKYRLSSYSWENKIERIEIVSETACFVTIRANRWGRVQEFREKKGPEMFRTWAEAHAALVKRASQAVDDAREELAAAEAALSNVNAMQKPEGEA